jgi:glyoxylase-like metal-dependent hydrolase (beta-lactamase superfamily II)
MKETTYICKTCGIEYEPSPSPPLKCPVCEDERQYVPATGQAWTTMEEVNAKHKNIIEKISDNLYVIYSNPNFAIGQRAHLIISPSGNILWDCITNLDESTVEAIKKLGGIKAIAISHPHYFSSLTQWSKRFDDAEIYIHALDAEWLARRNDAIKFWEGDEILLWDGIRLIWCGGHFPGANILYWPAENSLLTGDTIQVCPDLKSVSFMYSYPNMIPLNQNAIQRIRKCVEPLDYDKIFGAFGRNIHSDAKKIMAFSVKRYLSIFE